MRKRNKLVCGVGINDADYRVAEFVTIIDDNGKTKQKQVWACPYYQRWKAMLTRCYSLKHQQRNPTYIGCSVCEEWLTFGCFKTWMEKQDWEGKELDKDVLIPGNKVYSSETCAFINMQVNHFLTERDAARGQWMIGVHWDSERKKFMAMCSCGDGKKVNLGRFNTEPEAHQAWLKRKQELAIKLAAEQTDPRVAKALIERYANYVVE